MQCAVERFIYRLIDTVEAVEPYFKAKPSKVFVKLYIVLQPSNRSLDMQQKYHDSRFRRMTLEGLKKR